LYESCLGGPKEQKKKDTHNSQPLLLPHQTENNKTTKANKRQNLQPKLHNKKNHPISQTSKTKKFTQTIHKQSHQTFLPIFWQA
jgi:hypothetical protein